MSQFKSASLKIIAALSGCCFIALGSLILYLQGQWFKKSPEGQYLYLGPGETIYYEIYGNEGPFLLLSHGLGSHSYDLRFLSQALSDKFRLIVWDRLNYAQSQSKTDPKDIDAIAMRTEKFMRALKLSEKIIYAGYSLGSIHALHFARKFPERITGLVLLDPPHPGEKKNAKNYYNSILPQYIETLEDHEKLSKTGWIQLKSILRHWFGNENARMQAIFSRKHIQMALAEARVFPELLDLVDYQQELADIPLLVLSRGYHVDLALRNSLAKLSPVGEQVQFEDFNHQDFILENQSHQVAKKISDYLDRRSAIAD